MVFWGSEMMFFEKIMGLGGFIIAEMDFVESHTYILSETSHDYIFILRNMNSVFFQLNYHMQKQFFLAGEWECY